MSDTPRTDAFEREWLDTDGCTDLTRLGFARTLERENASLRSALAQAREEALEEAAKQCEHMEAHPVDIEDGHAYDIYAWGLSKAAAAIRALKGSKP